MIAQRLEQGMKRGWRWAPARYVAIGGCLVVLDVALFMACIHWLGLAVPVSQLISRSVGSIVGFLGHRYFTFALERDGEGNALAEGSGYILATIITVAISPFVVGACINLAGGEIFLGKLIGEAVLVVWAYLITRLIFLGRWRS